MSWSTSELRVRLAPLNRFKPSSKIFYWPFQGGTSFVDLLCFCSVLCLLCLCARLFICALWSPAGKGLTSLLSFVVSTVSLSLSHCQVWYLSWLYGFLIFAPLLTLSPFPMDFRQLFSQFWKKIPIFKKKFFLEDWDFIFFFLFFFLKIGIFIQSTHTDTTWWHSPSI